MTLQMPQSWEYRLLSSAEEALKSHIPNPTIDADHSVIEAAYAHCDKLTRSHSRTFYMASGLLPYEKQCAARALYAFCRVTDDIVDEPGPVEKRKAELESWHRRIMATHPPASDPVALAWADTKARFNIPNGYAEQLIKGVRRDLHQVRYATFDDLAEYSYGVASTVGLMAMHIIGFAGEQALPYAVKMGVALQVTNILRDVSEDWHNGRIYLPQDELAEYDIDEDYIAAGQVDDRWRAFMRFQIERTHQLYEESWPGIAMLDHNGRFAIAAAAELYRAIMGDIEANDYNVFDRRAHLGTWGKIKRLPGIWWRNRRNQKSIN
jgi:15-cis-phytoene synthase